MLLSVKLKNGLTSLAEQMGMDITVNLKNITVLGRKSHFHAQKRQRHPPLRGMPAERRLP